MNQQRLIFFLVFISILFSACAPSVEFVSTGKNKAPKQNSYKMIVLDQDEKYSDKCVPIGEIEIYDAGLAVNCGFESVIGKLIDKAKEVGADAVKITEVKKPDMVSTCYRMKGLAISYEGSDSLTENNLLAQPDLSFLTFSDAQSCKDDGDTSFISQNLGKINVIPFFAFTVYDIGRSELVRYPLTESRIQSHLKMLLLTTHHPVNVIAKDSKDYDAYLKYFVSVSEKAKIGKGSPLEWGSSLNQNLIDSASIIYMPFAIERESQRHVQARFYTLIADSRGRIIFSRCFEFSPDKWSKDFNSFANDVEGKLPIIWK